MPRRFMSEEKSYTVYALESEKNGMLYIGFTEDVDRRLREHNAGKSKFTKGYRPWKLVYTEVIYTRKEARRREKYLKSTTGKRWLKTKLNKTP